jgi:hypothetical protein
MMHFPDRVYLSFLQRFLACCGVSAIAIAALAFGATARAQVPAPGSDTETPAPQYVPTDPLAGVRYDERWDVSLGAAYAHIKAGPPPLQEGANLGGLDLSGSMWAARHWAIEGTGRAYLGTSGAGPNPYSINGPFVSEYIFAGGPEWLGPHNKHGALTAHAMVGGAYGNFQQDLRQYTPQNVDFFNNQLALAAVIGGHIDLNRSPRWVFRITPDAKYTRYSINYDNRATYGYWNFALSVGMEYKFKKRR